MYHSILKLLKMNKGVNKKFIVAYLVGLMYMLILLIPPEITRSVVTAIQNKDKGALYSIIYYAIFAVFMTIIAIYLEKVLLVKALNASEKNIQAKLVMTICNMKKKKFQTHSAGTLITQITQNVTDAITKGFEAVYSLVVGGVGLIVIFAYMSYLSVELMIALAIFNVIVIVITSTVSKKLKHIHQNVIQLNNEGNHLLLELLDNAVLVRLFEKNHFFGKLYTKNEHGIYQANLKAFALQNGINEFIWGAKKIAEIALIFGIGGYLVSVHKIDISIIASYTLISDIFTKMLNLVVNSIFSMNKAIPSINTLTQLLEEEDLEQEALQTLVGAKGHITFNNVSFKHGEQKIFDQVSFRINAGDKVMIVGENGQGKSTLLNLISGMYRPDEGEILIDHHRLNDIHIGNISELYCYISQKPHLFIGDGYQNVALAEHYESNHYTELLQHLGIEALAKENPKFYSEGEKQRLCIGRAIYQSIEKPIILGDEIFANIDKENKKHISDLLAKKFRDKTVIMVCHDESYLKFNKKLIVGNGKIELVDIGRA